MMTTTSICACTQGLLKPDLAHHVGGNFGTREAKEQRGYLKTDYNSPAGNVPWKDMMIKFGCWLTHIISAQIRTDAEMSLI